MKNLLIYTNPAKKFEGDNVALVKIHIDNSLEPGWDRKDILLYTNFPYEYNGIKSIVVSDRLHLKWDKTSNKILVIRDLLNKGLLKGLYWYHDFDAYENTRIQESDLGLEGFDLGLTGYGYKPQCNGGSIFFRDTAKDIFNEWCEKLLKIVRTRADEKTMTDMTRDGSMDKYRYKSLNITYNFGMRYLQYNYKRAKLPLKVLHFHPYYNDIHLHHSTKDAFIYGKNFQNKPLMSDRLIRLFHKHGIK